MGLNAYPDDICKSWVKKLHCRLAIVRILARTKTTSKFTCPWLLAVLACKYYENKPQNFREYLWLHMSHICLAFSNHFQTIWKVSCSSLS